MPLEPGAVTRRVGRGVPRPAATGRPSPGAGLAGPAGADRHRAQRARRPARAGSPALGHRPRPPDVPRQLRARPPGGAPPTTPLVRLRRLGLGPVPAHLRPPRLFDGQRTLAVRPRRRPPPALPVRHRVPVGGGPGPRRPGLRHRVSRPPSPRTDRRVRPGMGQPHRGPRQPWGSRYRGRGRGPTSVSSSRAAAPSPSASRWCRATCSPSSRTDRSTPPSSTRASTTVPTIWPCWSDCRALSSPRAWCSSPPNRWGELAYPWGPRLDGLSLWSTRIHGWLELGFAAGYFSEALARTGWRAEHRRATAVSALADVYITRSQREPIARRR